MCYLLCRSTSTILISAISIMAIIIRWKAWAVEHVAALFPVSVFERVCKVTDVYVCSPPVEAVKATMEKVVILERYILFHVQKEM